MLRKSLVGVAVLGVGLVVWAAGLRGAEPDSLVGKRPPDFSLKTLDGQTVRLSEQAGKVVVVDFWATWCPPCRKSLPHLQELSADKNLTSKGLVVWAVNAREDADRIKPFMATNNFTFPVPQDATGAVLEKYQVRGIPTTVIVGRDGTVAAVFVGYSDDTAGEIDAAVNKALREPAR